jgi:hypothetical protein
MVVMNAIQKNLILVCVRSRLIESPAVPDIAGSGRG